MTAVEEDPREPVAAERSRLAIPLFVVAGGLLVTVLALLVPLIPGPFRKLLLLPLGLGVAAGWLLAATAVHAGVIGRLSDRSLLLLGAVLILVCLGAAQYRLFLQWQAEVTRDDAAVSLARVASGLAATTGIPAEVRADLQHAAARAGGEFTCGRWLTYRVSRLGEWTETSALLFLCGESLLGVLAGAFLFRRQLRRE